MRTCAIMRQWKWPLHYRLSQELTKINGRHYGQGGWMFICWPTSCPQLSSFIIVREMFRLVTNYDKQLVIEPGVLSLPLHHTVLDNILNHVNSRKCVGKIKGRVWLAKFTHQWCFMLQFFTLNSHQFCFLKTPDWLLYLMPWEWK